MLHVCHLIHGLGFGGAEQVLVDLARSAPEVGLRLSVVSLVDQPNTLHTQALRDLDVDVRSLSLRNRWDPRAFPRAARVVDELCPDVVHSHMKHADLVGAVIARTAGLPLVSTLHVIEDAPRPLTRVKRRLAAEARSRAAARVIAVSDAQRRWYVREYPTAGDRVVTIPNGVWTPTPPDAAGRERLRACLGVSAEAVLALSLTVMRPEKGLDDLLAAVCELPADSPAVLLLAGDGEERRRLEAIAGRDSRLSQRVQFVGWRTDAFDLMHAADVVVHPSHADALPTTLILSLAAGTPIIATEVGGVPEIVGDEAGVLVRPHDPAQLATALADLAATPALREKMGEAARRRFAGRFDCVTWATQLAQLYRQVLIEQEAHQPPSRWLVALGQQLLSRTAGRTKRWTTG